MLTDPVEIEIISKAKQKNVRDPKRSRQHFERIYADFLSDVDCDNKIFLDLGPGQYDFGVLGSERGATTVGFDNDPAVLELGRVKGFEVHDIQLKSSVSEEHLARYDGLFCKFSINAFWFADDLNKLEKSIEALDKLLNGDGWAWIAPWNGVPKNKELTDEQIHNIVAKQNDVFSSLNYEVFDMSDDLARHYGVNGTTQNHALFIKNLSVPGKLTDFKV